MKQILPFLAVLYTSLPASALDLQTEDYDVRYHHKYSDLRGKENSCSLKIFDDEYGNVIIRVSPEPTGNWIWVKIPSNKLPFKDGDTFSFRSPISQAVSKVTYQNGFLSHQIQSVTEHSKFYLLHNIEIKTDGQLNDVDFVEAQRLSAYKSIFGKMKTKKTIQLKCYFN